MSASFSPPASSEGLEAEFVLTALEPHDEAAVEALLAGLEEADAARLSEPLVALLGTMASTLEDRQAQAGATPGAVRFCLTGPEHGFAAVMLPALQCRLNPALHLAPVMRWLRARLDSPRLAERLSASGNSLEHEKGDVWLLSRNARPALRQPLEPLIEPAVVFVPRWARAAESAFEEASAPQEEAPRTNGLGVGLRC